MIMTNHELEKRKLEKRSLKNLGNSFFFNLFFFQCWILNKEMEYNLITLKNGVRGFVTVVPFVETHTVKLFGCFGAGEIYLETRFGLVDYHSCFTFKLGPGSGVFFLT